MVGCGGAAEGDPVLLVPVGVELARLLVDLDVGDLEPGQG